MNEFLLSLVQHVADVMLTQHLLFRAASGLESGAANASSCFVLTPHADMTSPTEVESGQHKRHLQVRFIVPDESELSLRDDLPQKTCDSRQVN